MADEARARYDAQLERIYYKAEVGWDTSFEEIRYNVIFFISERYFYVGI
jgi:hypothetical protein